MIEKINQIEDIKGIYFYVYGDKNHKGHNHNKASGKVSPQEIIEFVRFVYEFEDITRDLNIELYTAGKDKGAHSLLGPYTKVSYENTQKIYSTSRIVDKSLSFIFVTKS